MRHTLTTLGRWKWRIAAIALGAVVLLFVFPHPWFAYHVREGRLSLWSDRPFAPAAGRAVLGDIDSRLRTSPLDDGGKHDVFITNAHWRRMIYFNVSGGAAGVNRYPLPHVFIRKADVDRDMVFGASGKPAAPPRTLAYYAAHEITHSLTAEPLGPLRLWNRHLPQWVREGYADYVGMGGRVDIDELWRLKRAGDPQLSFKASGTYAQFRLLTAYFLEREHWSVDQLLASRMTLQEAEARMASGMAGR